MIVEAYSFYSGNPEEYSLITDLSELIREPDKKTEAGCFRDSTAKTEASCFRIDISTGVCICSLDASCFNSSKMQNYMKRIA